MAEATLKLITEGFSSLKWMGLVIEPLDIDMPGRGFNQAGNQIQQGCFTCSILSEQPDAFLALGAKREVGDDISFAQVLCQAAYLEHFFTE